MAADYVGSCRGELGFFIPPQNRPHAPLMHLNPHVAPIPFVGRCPLAVEHPLTLWVDLTGELAFFISQVNGWGFTVGWKLGL